MADDSILYGIMPVERWNELEPIFELRGETLPNVNMATAAVALDPETESIVGMLMLQLTEKADPLWIAPAYRHRVDYKLLFDMINHLNPDTYFMFPTNDVGEELAEGAGLEKVGTVYRRKRT